MRTTPSQELQFDAIIDVLKDQGTIEFQSGLTRLTLPQLYGLRGYCKRLLAMYHDPFIVMVFSYTSDEIHKKAKKDRKR